ncbi:hypothetical protein B0T22DRAFT_48876 [Podospora appendiculata]|uniref:Uncharacterized protein n=1 Tax=Podospora appendiculata TaxID=314037 RepID=A0AAE0XI18_9PEZI|nr:hypothetical protein B0T22DRAFT_48876 [Podospora appendiculata]
MGSAAATVCVCAARGNAVFPDVLCLHLPASSRKANRACPTGRAKADRSARYRGLSPLLSLRHHRDLSSFLLPFFSFFLSSLSCFHSHPLSSFLPPPSRLLSSMVWPRLNRFSFLLASFFADLVLFCCLPVGSSECVHCMYAECASRKLHSYLSSWRLSTTRRQAPLPVQLMPCDVMAIVSLQMPSFKFEASHPVLHRTSYAV